MRTNLFLDTKRISKKDLCCMIGEEKTSSIVDSAKATYEEFSPVLDEFFISNTGVVTCKFY